MPVGEEHLVLLGAVDDGRRQRALRLGRHEAAGGEQPGDGRQEGVALGRPVEGLRALAQGGDDGGAVAEAAGVLEEEAQEGAGVAAANAPVLRAAA
ncbi:MAG: hypothetical protein M9894_24720 [Planctomycetes bacterium]|nr:hypothetical protein [Planctomycetota bacterium]